MPSNTSDASTRDRRASGGVLDVSIVDDPDGTIRLVGIRDTITPANAHRLLDATRDLGIDVALHLDFSEASIPTSEALWQLEASVDELERRGYRLRVVGVDPLHPALTATTG